VYDALRLAANETKKHLVELGNVMQATHQRRQGFYQLLKTEHELAART